MRNKIILFLVMFFSFNCFAGETDIAIAIEDGLRYLESVQFEYGEFPTIFTPNIKEPERSLKTTLDSNLFATAMISDAIQFIDNKRVDRINKKAAKFIYSQLDSKEGLWSYFTTHNPKPIYPRIIYDLDDTVFASIVLQQNHISFPDNIAAIKANKNEQGIYKTFASPLLLKNDIDCGVNANVLSYLKENDPQVCDYVNKQVVSGKNCANYYTQLQAYYLIAHAYDNGVSCFAPSVPLITNYVVKQFKSENSSVDDSQFKTAIALNTLLHLGYHGWPVEGARDYLLKTQSKETGAWLAEDFWIWTVVDDQLKPFTLGRSNSSALTTALVLKALNKFTH